MSELPPLTAADVAELRAYTDRTSRIRKPHTLSALPRIDGSIEAAFHPELEDLVMRELAVHANFTFEDLDVELTLENVERFVRRAVTRLDKATILDEFGTVSLDVTNKLLKNIKRRPPVPPTISYQYGNANDKAMHEALFQWENTYTVYYLRKRLYAAIMHAIVHSYLDRREHEHEDAFYDDVEDLPPVEGHPSWTRDTRFMRDWQSWNPPSMPRNLQIPAELLDNGENYEISRPPPPGYEGFL